MQVIRFTSDESTCKVYVSLTKDEKAMEGELRKINILMIDELKAELSNYCIVRSDPTKKAFAIIEVGKTTSKNIVQKVNAICKFVTATFNEIYKFHMRKRPR